MGRYIMALDQGTTSSRCIIFNRRGEIISSAQYGFRQIFPRPGWVEHDPMEIWSTQYSSAVDALKNKGINASDIAAIGITNQRETTIMWDKNTGEPVYNAIVWQCRRTSEMCDALRTPEFEREIRERTGLILDPYFSATKIKWILDNVKGVRERAENGDILFGTVDSWLIWKLTGGKVHVTDYSNAARTMLFNIRDLRWDSYIMDRLGIPECIMPEPVPSCGEYGVTGEFGGDIRIMGAAGDQQASLFGQACFDEGDCKMTYGTGGFLLMNTGERPVMSDNGLLTTIAWGKDGRLSYALEGSVFVAGAAIQWLRDNMRFMSDSSESEAMARSVDDTGGVYVVPAFTGLGAPYWDPYARGAIIGITRGTEREHIVRAVLESIAFQTMDLAEAMADDTGKSISMFRVDGGACANDFLMQFQADMLETRVVRPVLIETTALGAACLAGLAAGYWKDEDDIKANIRIDRVFEPRIDEKTRREKKERWHDAVERSKGWAK
ncbi:MAG: glycerol kinase GlpK [Anaerovoracaceae bacterium]|jgi:glycerol kinase